MVVVLIGLVAGVIVAIAAQRRAHRLVRSSGGPMVWRPLRLVVVGVLAIAAAAGVGILNRNDLPIPFGTPLVILALELLLIQSLATALTRLQSRLAPTPRARCPRQRVAPSMAVGTRVAADRSGVGGVCCRRIHHSRNVDGDVGRFGRLIAILPGPAIDAQWVTCRRPRGGRPRGSRHSCCRGHPAEGCAEG